MACWPAPLPISNSFAGLGSHSASTAKMASLFLSAAGENPSIDEAYLDKDLCDTVKIMGVSLCILFTLGRLVYEFAL